MTISTGTAPADEEFIDITPPPGIMRDLSALPKAHLHIHLEATVRPTTLADLARQAGLPIPQTDGFVEFTMFNRRYLGLVPVMQGTHPILRVINEAVEDAAAVGVVYAEFGISPAFYVESFGSLEAAVEAMAAAARAAAEAHGIEVGLMMTVDRTGSTEAANETARVAVAFADRGVVSLGMAGDERNNPGVKYEEAFAIAKAGGLLSTPHAGELVGPESVRGAVWALQADRIQHGVRVIEDPALMKEVAELGICLDVCPTSNLMLAVVPSLSEHPLKALLEAGVRCSINADDPIFFGPGILNEYVLSRLQLGLTDEQLADCAWSSIDCSGASSELKARSRLEIDAWLARTS